MRQWLFRVSLLTSCRKPSKSVYIRLRLFRKTVNLISSKKHKSKKTQKQKKNKNKQLKYKALPLRSEKVGSPPPLRRCLLLRLKNAEISCLHRRRTVWHLEMFNFDFSAFNLRLKVFTYLLDLRSNKVLGAFISSYGLMEQEVS